MRAYLYTTIIIVLAMIIGLWIGMPLTRAQSSIEPENPSVSDASETSVSETDEVGSIDNTTETDTSSLESSSESLTEASADSVSADDTFIETQSPPITDTSEPLVSETSDDSADSVEVVTNQQITVIVPPPQPIYINNNDPVLLQKTDETDRAKVGDVLVYRLIVDNPKDHDITGVRIVDHLPQFLVPLAISPDANADPATRTITWEDQTLSAGSQVTFAIRAQVQNGAPDGYVLHNTAEINGDGVRGSAADDTTIVATAEAVPSMQPPAPITAPTGTSVPAMAMPIAMMTMGLALFTKFVRVR